MKLVKIEWVDSYGAGSAWQEIDNIQDIKHVCISVGYLAFDGKNIKIIVPHISPENKDIDSTLHGCGDMAIPCRSILKMINLKNGKTIKLDQ